MQVHRLKAVVSIFFLNKPLLYERNDWGVELWLFQIVKFWTNFFLRASVVIGLVLKMVLLCLQFWNPSLLKQFYTNNKSDSPSSDETMTRNHKHTTVSKGASPVFLGLYPSKLNTPVPLDWCLFLILPFVLPPPLLSSCFVQVQEMHLPERFVAHLSLSLSPHLFQYSSLSPPPPHCCLVSRERGRVAGSQRRTAHPSITPAGSLQCWALSSTTQLLPSIKMYRWAGMHTHIL